MATFPFRNNALVLGANNSNIPRIIAVIAEAFAEEVFELETEVKGRLIQLIRHIQVILGHCEYPLLSNIICQTLQ